MRRWTILGVVLGVAALFGCADTPPGTGLNGGNNANSANNDANSGSNNANNANNNANSANSSTLCEDRDGDGFFAGAGCGGGPEDCNDRSDAVHPEGAEVCGDRLDNDCNGAPDDGCACMAGQTRLCNSAVDPLTITEEMRCRAGVQGCVDGGWGASCEGQVLGADEACNNLDDDCDGGIDEGLRDAIGRCLSDNPPPLEEDCGPTAEGNGLDDNGNGVVDETCSCLPPRADPTLPRMNQPCYSGPPQTLGVGECHGGTRDCGVDGVWGACGGETLPAAEVCGDGLDNDCDGFIDEVCSRCGPPTEEVCDGVDNNCDGVIDEGVRNACGGCGEASATDICGDGLDNDCDGQVDDGCGCTAATQECYTGPAEVAGLGRCERGSQTCNGEFWGTCNGAVLPIVELCGDGLGNGIDDDCDGQTDEGCGCAEGSTRPCGDSAGICEYGAQTCSSGQWGECVGGVGPRTEQCDGADNNCDGLVDEGLLNACGTCGESCYLEPANPDTTGDRDEGAQLIAGDDPTNPTGRPGLTLSQNSFLPPFLWAANHDFDTVTRFNTDNEREEGIYWAGDNPSRTAVDLDGNVWVGGRDDGRLTKVLWDISSCPDRNGNGQVDTSGGANGVVTPLNSPGNPLGDECVVYSAVPNPGRPSIRGIAAAPDGKVWLGYSGGGVQWIDPHSFELGPFIDAANAPLFAPDGNGVQQPLEGQFGNTGGVYGLVVDARGQLYTSSYNRNTLARLDTQTGQWVAMYTQLGCGTYGIAIDGRDRVWLGSWPGGSGVGMFDPATNRLHCFGVPNGTAVSPGSNSPVDYSDRGVSTGAVGSWDTTGVGVEPATGHVWTSFFRWGYTGRLVLNEADLSQSRWYYIGVTKDDAGNNLPGVGNDLRGVGFDRNGFGWTLGLASGNVYKIDPMNVAAPDNPGAARRADSIPNGVTIGQGTHYTYSDFTGSTVLSFTAPRGYWRFEFDTGFGEAQIDAIDWQAFVPPGTSVGLRIRALDRFGTPGTWVPPDTNGIPDFIPFPSGVTQHSILLQQHGGPLVGARFEVEVRLTTNDNEVRPIIHDVRLRWQRP